MNVSDHVAVVLNETFGEDVENLVNVDEILQEYQRKEQFLANAILESEKQTTDNVYQIANSCKLLLEEFADLDNQIDVIISQHNSYADTAAKMEMDIQDMHSKVKSIENEQMYLLWLKEVRTLSYDADNSIQKKNIQNAVSKYNKLNSLRKTLRTTACANFKSIVDQTCLRLFDSLKDTLSKEFNMLLTAVKYPFPTGISSPHFNKKEDTEEQFRKSLNLLSALNPFDYEESKNSLIVDHLVEPLKKRFYFHFYGERHTNNPEKPEWYFTQVLNWIKDHSSFLIDYIVPIVEKSSGESDACELKGEFDRTLVDLVEEKLIDTIEVIRNNDNIVAHLIDETIIFEKDLKESTESKLGVLHILLREDFLHIWLELEEKFTYEWLNGRLEDPDAWIPKFSDLATNDKNLIYYAPKCVEEFVTFVTLMNKRHKNLCDKKAEYKFLKLLIRNMVTFVDRMKNISHGSMMHPLTQTYCSLVNGACYMLQVVEELSEDIYFVQMATDDEIGNVNGDDHIFSTVLIDLKKLISSCAESIVYNLKMSLQTKLYPYKSETWQSLPPIKDYIKPSLSSGACDMMLYIKEHLHLLEERLCPDVFDKVWKQFTTTIDQLIFSEIVCESHFNEGGANQLQFDLRENLFTLFGQYTARPDSYFKLLKDSCTLLNLSTGTAYLLKELLQQQQHKNKEEVEQDVMSSLKEMGVSFLTSYQAGRLINSRIDYWPVS